MVRVLFAAGISNQVDLINITRVATSASYFTGGTRDFGLAFILARNELGGIRNFIFYAPDLLFYLVLGITQVSSLVLSLAFSLVSIFVIYAIGFIQTNKRVVGLFAALIISFFPLDIFYSTAAPRISRMTFLFLLFVYCLLLAVKKRSRVAMGFGFLILIIILLWQPPLLVISLTITLAAFFYSSPRSRLLVIVLWITIGLLLLLGWQQVGMAFLSLYSLILGQPEMVIFLPLFIVAITVLMFRSEKSAEVPLLGSLIVIFGYISLAIFLNPSEKPDLFNAGIFLQPLFAFLAIALGIYFSGDLTQRQGINWTCALAVIAAVGAWLAVIGSSDFLPSFQGFDWLGFHSLFLIYSILAGTAFAVVMISPYLVTGTKTEWKTRARFAILVIILLATLSFSWKRRNEYHYLSAASAQALVNISENELSLPIYVVSEETYLRLGYMSNMAEIVGDNHLQISLISLDQSDQIQEGLIFMFDDELTAPPPDRLWRVGVYGDLGEPRMVVYQIRSLQLANDFILHASFADVKPLDIYGALLNAGLPCNGYQAWEDSAQIDLSTVYFTPYSVPFGCVLPGNNLVSIDDLANRNNLEGYMYFPSSSEDTLDMAQVTLPIYDLRTSRITVELKPSSLYLYSIDIKTTSPTATLYWRVGDAEDYLERRSYPEWETVAALIRTPDWEYPQDVSFSPALFDHLDIVSVRNFFIGPVDLIATQP
jgi:hypothetical protein